MMFMKAGIYLMTTASLLLYQPGYAQEPAAQPADNEPYWWIDFGAGLGGGAPKTEDELFADAYSIAAIASLSYQFKANLLSLRTAQVINMNNFFFFFGTGELSSVRDVAFLYGRVKTSENSRASLAAGIGFARSALQDAVFFVPTSRAKTEKAVGLALETQFCVQPTAFLGIGVNGFGNINSKNSFYGVTLSLQLGKLR